MQIVISAEAPTALIELCGITLIERLLRTLQRVGVREAIIYSKTPSMIEAELSKKSLPRSEIAVRVARSADAISGSELHLLLPGDAVWDERLLRLLLRQTEPCRLVDNGRPTGAVVSRVDAPGAEARVLDIASQPTYSLNMRRDLRPLWIPAPTSVAQSREAERRILDAAQKGSLDFPAYVDGPIETFLVARLCKTSITPNQLTALCNVVAWMAAVLFATGHLVSGTALALAVEVLDGLDGKQARVKVETSEAGKLEHWLDTLYELAWAAALAYHFQASGQLPDAYKYLLLLLAAEGVDGLAKLSIIRRYGRLIDELSPLDRKIRLLGGRRNIYVWILAAGLLLGSPAKSFVVMAYWEAVTAVVHVARAFWAIWIRPFDFSASAE
ncbi:MAG TPA: CDP-alcohol phosphatidyltransferase family protein [Chthoniobacterales bacterium]